MRKVLSAFLIAFILTAAGCGGDNTQETTESTAAPTGETTTAAEETTDGSTNKVTQIAYKNPEGDTTEEALAILEKEVPLFADYLKIRMHAPVTVEATVTAEDGSEIKSGIYISDDMNVALLTKDSNGNTSRVIYTSNMAYEINDSEKTVYYLEIAEDWAKEIADTYLLKIKLSDVEKCRFVQDFEEFEGVVYKHEIVYNEDGSVNNYYFDENTNEIKYIRTGDDVTKLDKVENAVSDMSVFEIPSDYQQISFTEYLEEQEKLAEQEAAQTAE